MKKEKAYRWKVCEAIKALREGDIEARIDLATRFPLFSTATDEEILDEITLMTARQVEIRMKKNLLEGETVDDEAKEIKEVKKSIKKKQKKVEKAKIESKDDVDDFFDDDETSEAEEEVEEVEAEVEKSEEESPKEKPKEDIAEDDLDDLFSDMED